MKRVRNGMLGMSGVIFAAILFGADPSRAAARTEEAGKPWVSLGSAKPIAIDGGTSLRSGLSSSGDRLASGDFDEDGAPELVIGESDGSLLLLKGNPEPHRPNYDWARSSRRRGSASDSFFGPEALRLSYGLVPNEILIGDFDSDGHEDLAVAEMGADRIEWRRGDGTGAFGDLERVVLFARVTAASVGDVNRPDRKGDLLVAIESGRGAELLVFESSAGGLGAEPELLRLPSNGSVIRVGDLDGDFLSDVAVACGDRVELVYGRDRELGRDASRRRDRGVETGSIVVGSAVRDLAIGDFDVNDGRHQEIAALTESGDIAVLARPLAEERGNTSRVELRPSRTLRAASAQRLRAADLSSLPGTDLLAFGSNGDVVSFYPDAPSWRRRRVAMTSASSPVPQAGDAVRFEAPGGLADVIALPLGPFATDGLVVLPLEGAPTAAAPSPNATFTVTTTSPSGAGSLASAIVAANGTAGTDYIDFAIPGASVPMISPSLATHLPGIDEAVTIDATTQSAGFVQIDGSAFAAGSGQNGINLRDPNIALYGFVLSNFPGYAITTTGVVTGSLVRHCRIGTNAAGTAAAGNGEGIHPMSDALTIGGLLAGDGNLISGNDGNGIDLLNSGNIPIFGNFIGTNVGGTGALANLGYGIVAAIGGHSIGGTVASARNVISGNALDGVRITAGSATTIQGNIIGLNASGNAKVGNGGAGVSILYPGWATIGGTSAAARNVISGNATGVRLDKSYGTDILGNTIGLDLSGATSLGNSGDGIELVNASVNCVIGGTVAGSRNVISGNGDDGISITGTGSATTSNEVLGNFIGLDANGTSDRGNVGDGIVISAADGEIIGGSVAAARNVISGNGANGILLTGGTINVDVLGNFIGLDKNGAAAVGNSGDGLEVSNASAVNVGGATSSVRNVISGNAGDGIYVASSASYLNINGNFVGVDANGALDRGNAQNGVRLTVGTNVEIGGGAAGEGNVISGNGFDGIVLGAACANVNVYGNKLGTNVSGGSAIPNGRYGLHLNGADLVNVGASGASQGNVVSGNGDAGVRIASGANQNKLVGNVIGTNAAGTSAIPNLVGISILDSSSNEIGRTVSQGNLVSGNLEAGIVVSGATASGNSIRGNLIGTNLSQTAAIPNGLSGVLVTGAPGTQIGVVDSVNDASNVIAGNDGSGVRITGTGATNTSISTNWIGCTRYGVVAMGNGSHGVDVAGAPGVVVGGKTDSAARNVIVSNTGAGVRVQGAASSGTEIANNFIGIPPTGLSGFGNGGAGVELLDTTQTMVGGITAAAKNWISSNGGAGVAITATAGNACNLNRVYGNTFGADPTSNSQRPNLGASVAISGNAAANSVGGINAGQANLFRFHTGSPVVVSGGTTPVRGNSYYWGIVPGIDLIPAGVTANDALDADSGPNQLQNKPVVTNVSVAGGMVTLSGTLASTPNSLFTIDVYRDPFGGGAYGEWAGSTTATTNASGDATFTFTTSGSLFYPSATATDSAGNTSEFSSLFYAPASVGEASANGGMTAAKNGSQVQVSYTSASCGATNHTIYWGTGTISGGLVWTGSACSLGTSGSATFVAPSADLVYFVIAGEDGSKEGPYGFDSNGNAMPEASGIGACDRPMVVGNACP